VTGITNHLIVCTLVLRHWPIIGPLHLAKKYVYDRDTTTRVQPCMMPSWVNAGAQGKYRVGSTGISQSSHVLGKNGMQ